MTIRLTLLLAVVMGTSLHAAEQGPGFSIHNKSKNTIYVDVCTGIIKICEARAFMMGGGNAARPDFRLDKTINIKEASLVRIFDANKKELCNVVFDKGTTIYINFDGKKLYPQKGALGGFLGKITGDAKTGGILESGPSYSLGNNTKKEVSCK